MLSSSEAKALADERAESRVNELLEEVEAAIIERCEVGKYCVTWEAWNIPEQTRYIVAHELRMKGYRVGHEPNNSLFIRWGV